MAVVDSRQHVLFNYENLLQMSREKTARLRKEMDAPKFVLEGRECE
jgi:hypothetical protein